MKKNFLYPKMALQQWKMSHILHYKYNPKLDPLALKYMPNLHNILDWAKKFTTKTRFELEFNTTNFVKDKLWIKEIWGAQVAVIENVKFWHMVPLGVNGLLPSLFKRSLGNNLSA